MRDAFGFETTYAQDEAGQFQSMTSLSGQVSLVVERRRSSRSMRTTCIGNGTLVGDANRFPRDASAIYDFDASLSAITHTDPASAVLASFTMGYDAAGNITSITDGQPARVREFGYDELHRLRSEQTLPAPAGLYDYDAAGNRTTSPLSASHVHDDLNRLADDDDFTYAYDDSGNLTQKTATPGGQTTTYHWDARSRLAGITLPGGGSLSYRYDALGRRVEKTTGTSTTRYVYDGEDIALETDGAGTLRRRYRHGDGIDQPLVAEDVAANESYFLHADHLGSIRLVTDEAGDVASEYDYDAYGRRTAVSEGFVQPYAYTGREWDGESGLYYYRARYYDPALGRFLSEDPIGFAGGDLSLYRYVQNSPISYTDPSGKNLNAGLFCFAIVEGLWNFLGPIDDVMKAKKVVDTVEAVSTAREKLDPCEEDGGPPLHETDPELDEIDDLEELPRLTLEEFAKLNELAVDLLYNRFPHPVRLTGWGICVVVTLIPVTP